MKEYDKNLRDIVSILDPDSRPVGGKLQAEEPALSARLVPSRSTRIRIAERLLRPKAGTIRC